MSQFDFDLFYERNLPHYQPEGATLFITFRLAGSLPKEVMDQLFDELDRQKDLLKLHPEAHNNSETLRKLKKKMFGRWDSEMDKNMTGPRWLKDSEIAQIVANCLFALDGNQYTLDAFCIMPNHVHLVCTPLMNGEIYISIPSIMQKIKGLTARQINIALGRQGEFWQHESYDHVVRNDLELNRIVEYVLNNPIRVGLPPDWVYSRFSKE